MTTAAQFEWTEDRNPEAGEFTSSRKPWNAITEFTFNDLDHNGKPFDLSQVLDGERLNLAAHKGAAEYTVVTVTDRTVTVAPIYGYGDPIPGTVTTITTRAEGDFDYDDTALIARIAAEEKKREEEDALLQGQIDGKADKDHDHPDLEVGDHNHDSDYAPKTHDHNQYSPLGHGHSEFTHDHDTLYAPTVHEHPHGHTEFDQLKAKDADQDKRLDALEAEDEDDNGYDNAYNPGDPLNEGEYSAGDKTATFNETDAEGNEFATPDDPWLVTCDDGPIMRITGAAAGATDQQGRVTVTWDSDHTLSGYVKLGVVDPVAEHQHEQYASKSDLESLEAELELLAKTLETGQWEVSDTPMVRPGQMHLAFDQFNVQQNVLTINNEDLGGKTHGWSTVDEGDYLELIDKTDQQGRNIEHDYALFLVTKVDKGNGIATINLDLYQGQGEVAAEEVFEVRVIDIAESELDMAALDERYIRKEADNSTYKDWLLKADGNKKNPEDFAPKHSHPYAASSHSHSGQGSFTPDRAWYEATHCVWDGSEIHRQQSYTYPRYAGDWSAQKQNGNAGMSSTQVSSIYQLGIYPPWGKNGWEGGYTGLIAFGEDRWSEDPIVVFQVIRLERSTDYFRWHVRQLWTCNTSLQLSDLDGKSFIAMQGAVYK